MFRSSFWPSRVNYFGETVMSSEISRIEACSDGVYAVAVTLLI